MKAELRPIRRLYFQFGHLVLRPRLDAWQIATALEQAGFIRIKAESLGAPTHFEWTDLLTKETPEHLAIPTVMRTLRDYCRALLKMKPALFGLELYELTADPVTQTWSGTITSTELDVSERKALEIPRGKWRKVTVHGTFSLAGHIASLAEEVTLTVGEGKCETNLIRFAQGNIEETVLRALAEQGETLSG